MAPPLETSSTLPGLSSSVEFARCHQTDTAAIDEIGRARCIGLIAVVDPFAGRAESCVGANGDIAASA